MPWPLSAMTSSTIESDAVSEASTRPPRGVNLMALLSRFQTTCCSLVGSPNSDAPSAGTEWRSETPFAVLDGKTEVTAASTTGAKSIGCRSRRSLPDRMRETSSRSSISWLCALALRSIVATPSATTAGGTSPCWRIVVQPTMALSGVRSSCDSVARNSSFRRFASSASRRTARSNSSSRVRSSASCRNRASLSLSIDSYRRRSVTSTHVPMKPEKSSSSRARGARRGRAPSGTRHRGGAGGIRASRVPGKRSGGHTPAATDRRRRDGRRRGIRRQPRRSVNTRRTRATSG